MRYLRTNTATRITVGPFLDKTDGITPKVALTVTSEKLTFVVDTAGVPTLILDAAPTASGGANDMVHITNDDSGFYDLELAAADVNYLGRAMLSLNDVATHCPVFHEFMILPAMIYDSFVLGTDTLDSSLTQILGATPAVTNLSRGVLATTIGTVGSASTATSIVTSSLDPAAAVTDQFKGKVVSFDRATTTVNLRGQSTIITGSTSGGALTVVALTTAPVSGDTFTIT